MHVLSLPPAFVLSQDQTLKLKASLSALPPGGLPEHIRDTILDVKPKHISHNQDINPDCITSVLCSRPTKKQKPQNSEADTHIIGQTKATLASRYVSGRSIEKRTKPPTYLFKFPSLSNSNKTKQHELRQSHGAIQATNLEFQSRFSNPSPQLPATSAAGEALSRQSSSAPQEKI